MSHVLRRGGAKVRVVRGLGGLNARRVRADIRTVFWWFKRGNEFVRYEARRIDERVCELRFIKADGTESIERFDDEQQLTDRQRELEHDLSSDGWTGPHGWNL